MIWADHDRLEQVFVNLLSNAFGHNPPGTTVAISAAADGPGHVVVTVADDGAGLPAELAAAPFEPARRRRTATSGAGLGLSIARGIVAEHGGQIELTQPARGTCFRIRLPVEAPAETPGPAVVPAAEPVTEQADRASRLAAALPEPQRPVPREMVTRPAGQQEIGVTPGA